MSDLQSDSVNKLELDRQQSSELKHLSKERLKRFKKSFEAKWLKNKLNKLENEHNEKE